MDRNRSIGVGHELWQAKLRSILLLFVLLLQSLTACNKTSTSSGQISFMVFGDPAELAAYQTLVDAFDKKHPQIEVEVIHIPSQSDYRTRLAADIAAGTPADGVLINYRRYASFAAKNALQPLDSYLAQSAFIEESDFYQQSIDPFKWQGHLI